MMMTNPTIRTRDIARFVVFLVALTIQHDATVMAKAAGTSFPSNVNLPPSQWTQIVALAGGNNEDDSSGMIHTHDIAVGKQRTDFVRHILTDRLKYVSSGRRMADFHTWLRKRGGHAAVMSMHGVEVDYDTAMERQELQQAPDQENFQYDENHKAIQVLARNDPFAMNRLDMDLPVNNLPNLYEGKPIHLLDDLQPSLVQLIFRTIQLSFKFSPVLSTVWVAVISSKFRRVWYKWVATSLGKSLVGCGLFQKYTVQ